MSECSVQTLKWGATWPSREQFHELADQGYRVIPIVHTWEYAGYNMLIFYSSLSTIPHSLYEAASIDGASEWQIVKKIKLPELKGSLAITVIFSIIGSFQLFNEPSILQNMVPGNAITTYYTPNMYAYNLSFTGNQSNYAAALAIVMAIITMAIAYVVQLKSMKEQMK